jgi:hypothetical protein
VDSKAVIQALKSKHIGAIGKFPKPMRKESDSGV